MLLYYVSTFKYARYYTENLGVLQNTLIKLYSIIIYNKI